MAQKKHLVVGIDPGTTTGVAVIGLDGRILGIYSSRTMNLKDLIHLIISHGFPLVIATDVTPAPAFVVRVSHLFEAVLQEPPHPLSLEEKRELARNHATRTGEELAFRNSHEKDAFAAAIKALEAYGDKFRWIDRKLEERGLADLSDRVKAMVVSGTSLSDSLSEVLGEREERRARKAPKPPKPERPKGEEREKARSTRNRRIESSMMKNMSSEILELKTQLKEREVKILSLQNELERANSAKHWEIVRSKEIDSRNKMITELKRSLSRVAEDRNRLRRQMDSAPGSGLGTVAGRIQTIRVVPNLTRKTVAALDESQRGGSRILYVTDASGAGSSIAAALSEIGTEAVVTPSKVPHQAMESLDSSGIVVIPAGRVDILVFEDLALAETRALDHAIERERKALARRSAKAATDQFRKYLSEYREEVTSRR